MTFSVCFTLSFLQIRIAHFIVTVVHIASIIRVHLTHDRWFPRRVLRYYMVVVTRIIRTGCGRTSDHWNSTNVFGRSIVSYRLADCWRFVSQLARLPPTVWPSPHCPTSSLPLSPFHSGGQPVIDVVEAVWNAAVPRRGAADVACGFTKVYSQTHTCRPRSRRQDSCAD